MSVANPNKSLGYGASRLTQPTLKLFLRQVLEPVSKFASVQVGLRRKMPNPNIIHGVLGFATLTPTYMEIILRQILILTR